MFYLTASCQAKPWISDFKFAEGQMLIGQPLHVNSGIKAMEVNIR